MTSINMEEAQAIAGELHRMHDEVDSLMKETGDRRSFTDAEVESLQKRLKAIKGEIKAAAKHGTLSRKKFALTDLERCFFAPAVQRASASFRLTINANPRKVSWVSGLYDVADDLSYYLNNLETYLSENS
ncbi:hypothetical protein [Metapseudomonas furukawaii]|uniref:hypothetical protein n=1 Tax=Metapseudomonas furukawaii TaxID=1149133 RepID=UPI000568BF40|nr:hypothetical protein [Pseudomonas furukawaii]